MRLREGRGDFPKRRTNDTTELFVALAAAEAGVEAAGLLRESEWAADFQALEAGLRLDAGEDVRAPVEVLEVGKDVAARIAKRREDWAARGLRPAKPCASKDMKQAADSRRSTSSTHLAQTGG